MNLKNVWMKGLAVAALSCAAGATLAQTPPDGGQARKAPSAGPFFLSHNITPLTPEEEAASKLQWQLEEAATKELDAGQFAQAEADAKQALAVYKFDSGLGWELLAGALDAQGKDREALQVYGHMAGQGYNPPRVWLPYALLLLKAGQWAPAVAAYNQALPDVTSHGDLRPDVPLPSDGPLPRVGDLLRESSHFSPDTPEPRALATALHIALGLTQVDIAALGTASQKNRALAHFQSALDLSPASDVANYYYGYGLQRLGHTAQANAAFQKTVKMAKGEVKAAAERALKKNKNPV